MAQLSISNLGFSSSGTRLGTTIGNMRDRVARHRRYRHTLHELQSLTPRDLAELGISPADIGNIARQAAEG